MMLREHAVRELKLAGAEITGNGFNHVMQLIETLISQNHVEANTMRLVVAAFFQLCNGETLSPLRGTDDEWTVVSPTLSQNNRCERVFKELGVGCYDVQATVFVDEHERMFTKQPQSRKMVAFPYVPHTTFVKVKTGPDLILPKGVRRQ